MKLSEKAVMHWGLDFNEKKLDYVKRLSGFETWFKYYGQFNKEKTFSNDFTNAMLGSEE